LTARDFANVFGHVGHSIDLVTPLESPIHTAR
jgi:hypothetical protein